MMQILPFSGENHPGYYRTLRPSRYDKQLYTH